jgi:hypothetical protein
VSNDCSPWYSGGAWGQTFSLRILAIRVALQHGLLNRVILEDETAQLDAWLHTYRRETAT